METAPKVKPPQRNDVFVGNIPFGTTDDDLRRIFSTVGTVVSVRSVIDHNTGKPKGFAFIEYEDMATAYSAIRNLEGHPIDGRKLNVRYSHNSTVQDPTGESTGSKYRDSKITQALSNLSDYEMWDIVANMKEMAEANEGQLKTLLVTYPQISDAILQILIKQGMYTPPTEEEQKVMLQDQQQPQHRPPPPPANLPKPQVFAPGQMPPPQMMVPPPQMQPPFRPPQFNNMPPFPQQAMGGMMGNPHMQQFMNNPHMQGGHPMMGGPPPPQQQQQQQQPPPQQQHDHNGNFGGIPEQLIVQLLNMQPQQIMQTYGPRGEEFLRIREEVLMRKQQQQGGYRM